RLWLCGKHLIGPDPEAAIARAGATTVVCLNQEPELGERYPDYVAWLRHHQPHRAVWHPVPDLHAPSLEEMLGLLRGLRTRLDAGETLLAHCGAGIGRAGTLAACLLIAMGDSAERALEVVARSRPTAGPEAGAQRELVDAVAGHFGT
ncbi:MAG: hypothetical protein MUE34_10675, partial [Acidimicrobiales bacterium]|nr:hypothetical protein [Acidimicrobiales bacterium]